MKRYITIPSLILTGAVAMTAGWAMEPAVNATFSVQPPPSTAPAEPMDCAAMAKMRDTMIAKQDAADARLGALVVAMNEATGATKADAAAAVINELVKQRVAMRGQMMHMQTATMNHMMQHMLEAAPSDMQKKMKEAMDGCPMTHGMGDKADGDLAPIGRRGTSSGG